MKKVPYASVVGSLIYAQVCTFPDISFVVSVFRRYLSKPGVAHWQAVKRVMRYLQDTKDYILTYKRVDHLEVTDYSDSDSDYDGWLDDHKSISDYIFMLVEGVISQ